MLTLKSKFKYGSAIILLMTTLMMAGCATQAMHNKGLDLVHEGKFEEGLDNLEAASKAEPGNLTYRADLVRSKEQIVNRMLRNATDELALGHFDAAQSIYERILKIDKDNRNAKLALDAMAMNKRHEALIEEAKKLFDQDDFEGARATLKPVLLENNKNSLAVALLRQIDEQQNKVQIAEPSLLRRFKKPVSLQFRDANVKMVFEALSRTTGINILLDKDVRPDIKTSIFVKDVSIEDAIDLILMQSELEKKILSDNTVYIYPNTPAKAKEFQDLKVRSFHLVNADPKQMMTMLKTLLKTKDIYVHEKTNSIVMRDTPDAINLAAKMIADQDIADPEVMLEVEVMEISRSRLSDIGAQFPNQVTFTALGNSAASTAASLTLNSLRQINGSTIGVSPAPAITLNAMLQDSDTNILSSPRLRVRNREKAKIMIGERVPMITNAITPVATGSPVITGTVTYQDVGLKLDVEPDIHLDNEVIIKIGLEVSSLGLPVSNGSGSTVYRVGTRNTSTSLRLHDGETQILAGLITDSDTSTKDKIPLLGQIPILGRLFSNDNGNKSKTEIILSITPHIVGNSKLAEASEMEYWSGTEAALRSNQMLLRPVGKVSLGNASESPAGMRVPYTPPTAAESSAGMPPVAATPAGAPPVAGAAASAPVAANPVSSPNKTGDVAAPQALKLNWQGPNQAKVGDKIKLLLNTDSAAGLKTLGFDIGFDPEVLKVIDVSEGSALKGNNSPSNMTKNINQSGGNISLEISGSGSAGTANIATITFEVTSIAQGTAVSVDSINATGASGDGIPVIAPESLAIAVTQ
jgi:general secretion pathway protein D